MSSHGSEEVSQGVEILTINGAVATQDYHGETVALGSGTLKALLVSIELQEAAKQALSAASSKQRELSTDLWLVLSIGDGDDFSMPVAATQTIVPQRNQSQNSYIFNSLEVEGASIKLALPSSTSKSQVSRFEQILAQYAAYQDDDRDAGKIELMDEDGQVLGVVQGNFTVHESDAVSDYGYEKEPVLIDLPPEPTSESEKQDLNVNVLSAQEKQDWMIRGADMISRNIIKGSEFIGGKIQGAAESYMAKHPAAGSSGTSTPNNEKVDDTSTKPGREPVKVGPKTTAGIERLGDLTGSAVKVSSKTTVAILRVAGNVGDRVGRATGIQSKPNPDGSEKTPKGIRGFVNRSLIAANTVLDGIDSGAQTLLYTSTDAAHNVVGHKYGDDARKAAEGISRTGKNVFIVYKDIRGVRRSALLKAAHSRVMKAKLDDGREVTVSVDEKGNAVASTISDTNEKASTSEKSSYTSAESSSTPPSYSASEKKL